jgi:SNF family Na+-dependent transporter
MKYFLLLLLAALAICAVITPTVQATALKKLKIQNKNSKNATASVNFLQSGNKVYNIKGKSSKTISNRLTGKGRPY